MSTDVTPFSGTVGIYAGAFNELSDGKFGIGDITAPAAAALDVLGWVCDPAGALVGAAIGPLLDYLANNLPPLKWPLDQLTGDAGAIKAHADAWQQLSNHVVSVGNSYASTGSDLSSWTQPASATYRDIQTGLVGAFQGTANQAAAVAEGVSILGQVCAGVRGFIWGLVKSFLSSAIANAIIAAASSIITCGGSLGAFAAWFSAKFASVVAKISSKLADLMRYLALVGVKLEKLSNAFMKAASKLDTIAAGQTAKAAASTKIADQAATSWARLMGLAGPKDKVPFDPKFAGGPGPWQQGVKDATKPYTKWPGKVNGAVNAGDKAERDDVGNAGTVNPLS